MTTVLPPFAATSGPRPARILIVGEAWGESESQVRKPFVGESGKELWRMLGEAMPDVSPDLHSAAAEMHKFGALAWVGKREDWLEAAGIAYTNVFALRPYDNKIEHLTVAKKEAEGLAAAEGRPYIWPMFSQGKYFRPELAPELARLYEEIEAFAPNLILALGNTACWATLGEVNIGSIRGTIRQSVDIRGKRYKVLPSYHPAGVMRQWAWRPIVVADLMKASREAETPEISRPQRFITTSPTIEQVENFLDALISSPPPLVGVDTETAAGLITMAGFARSRSEAFLVPFATDDRKSYWREAWQEERAWNAIDRVMGAKHVLKVLQNGLYDFQYFLKSGIRLEGCLHDTMLLHHSILPEMKKGLGFLGSIYTREPAWKLMRLQKQDTVKADE